MAKKVEALSDVLLHLTVAAAAKKCNVHVNKPNIHGHMYRPLSVITTELVLGLLVFYN